MNGAWNAKRDFPGYLKGWRVIGSTFTEDPYPTPIAHSPDEPSWEVFPSPLNDSHLAHLNDLWSARGRPCRMYGHPYTEDYYCERCGEPIGDDN